MLIKIFEVLNRSLLNNKVKTAIVKCMSTSEIQDLFDKTNHNRDASELYAVYYPVNVKFSSNSNKNKAVPIFSDEYLIVNASNGPYSFSFLVSAICHEMIHYVDFHDKDTELATCVFNQFNHGISYDEHATSIFMSKMNNANKNGLTVIQDGNGYDINELNDLSVFRFKKLMEMDNAIINESWSSKSNVITNVNDDGTFNISF